jgi:ribose-phosphate pyrophosphokinase
VPISAKLVANLLTVAGADRILTMDLHAGQIQGFFDIPLDHLFAVNVFVDYIEKLKLKKFVIVSPDVGGIKTARAYAKRLGAGLAIVDKRRLSPEKAEAMNILGEVEGCDAILVDDLIATGSSLLEAAAFLKKAGVKKVYAAIVHGVFSGDAVKNIEKSAIEELITTNTIPLADEKKISKIKTLSVATLFAEAIKRIHREESISCLFDERSK